MVGVADIVVDNPWDNARDNTLDKPLDNLCADPPSAPARACLRACGGTHMSAPAIRCALALSLQSRPVHLLRYLWPLPWTVVGLSLAVLAVALGGRWRWHRGALECSGGRLGRWAERGPFAAITLGHVILASSARQAERLAAHERGHVRQYEAWGPFFVPAYLLASVWALLCGGHVHADNAFERHAPPP